MSNNNVSGRSYGLGSSYNRPDETYHSEPILRFNPGTDDPLHAFDSAQVELQRNTLVNLKIEPESTLEERNILSKAKLYQSVLKGFQSEHQMSNFLKTVIKPEPVDDDDDVQILNQDTYTGTDQGNSIIEAQVEISTSGSTELNAHDNTNSRSDSENQMELEQMLTPVPETPFNTNQDESYFVLESNALDIDGRMKHEENLAIAASQSYQAAPIKSRKRTTKKMKPIAKRPNLTNTNQSNFELNVLDIEKHNSVERMVLEENLAIASQSYQAVPIIPKKITTKIIEPFVLDIEKNNNSDKLENTKMKADVPRRRSRKSTIPLAPTRVSTRIRKPRVMFDPS